MKSTFTLIVYTFLSILLIAQDNDNFGTLLNAVDLGSQTPTPDRSIVGIQFAEGNLWVTGFDPDDYWQHKLYKFSADGSSLIDTYSYGIEAAGWHDMAWDGEYLYVTDMDTIRQLNIVDGQKTGVVIPAPFYYNRGLAYNPYNDHFYVSGEGGFNIYEIDRDGNIINAIGGTSGNYYVGLAVDTISVGGPFLWSYINEEEGYSLNLKAKQISLQTNQFTGLEFEGASISSIINETAGGATIIYDQVTDSVRLVTINIRNGNAQDQYEYAMFYDITRDEIPGPQISVNPTAIQNTLPQGDSADITIDVFNDGDAPLFWSAFVETPDQDTINNLGEVLASFNASVQTPDYDRGLNAITFLNDIIYVNGRNFYGNQSAIYEFDKEGNFIAQHPYNAINPVGFSSLTTDGEYLYADDTYAILQINPESFSIEGYILKPSGTYRGFTYDPNTDHFWIGNSNGLVREIDRDGNEINVFITSYDIQGLAWDQFSPGGPYIWAWVETDASEGSKCEAIRLNPHTCTPSGASFIGTNFSNDPLFQDIPEGAVITNQWEDNKVTFIGLQKAGIIAGADTTENIGFVATYDLDVVPPPDWIELMFPAFGTTQQDSIGNFTVRLRSLMNDTIMSAVIRISNNDIDDPQVVIPINFEMAAAVTTGINDISNNGMELLGQNYPNPFKHATTIPVDLPENTEILLAVYNDTGKMVSLIYNGKLPAGKHEFTIWSQRLPPGVYYYQLKTNDNLEYRKMIINN
ncbi:MAG: T9SS type A sorting domain-containing protein [Bacteroidetes bacterium]|nr:T9SS type A sorting domain-containing protein [Bacteroidota bacterium]